MMERFLRKSSFSGDRVKYATVAAVVASLFVSSFSCKRSGKEENQFVFEREYRNGPVIFKLRLSDSSITIAERIEMMLEVRAEKGYRAELPRFGEKLSEFGIVDYRNFQPELAGDGAVISRRLYILEPFLSGEYRIPPMEIRFFAEGDSTEHFLESDTVKVLVRSLLGADTAALTINDIEPPVSYPWSVHKAAIAAAGVAIAVAALFFKYRRIREKIIPPLPAHEKAYLALQKLLESGMLEERRYREFTAEVADILRRYIEDRFGLKAPERTTEEFLTEAGFGLPATSEQKKILEDFLTYCDLVKFAALEPSSEDVKSSFNTCKDFIEATKEEPAARIQAERAEAWTR